LPLFAELPRRVFSESGGFRRYMFSETHSTVLDKPDIEELRGYDASRVRL
jgi:hypothetical protein